MGDIPHRHGAPTDFLRQNAAPVTATTGPVTQPTYLQDQVALEYSSGFQPILQQQQQQQQQQQFAPPAHQVFSSSQLDMAQAQGPQHPSLYNMAAMANALPQANFRPGQYCQPGQHRFNNASAASAAMAAGPVSMGHYGTQGGMPNAQQYYMPQHAQMPPAYYGAPSLSPTQQGTTVGSRGNMGYYPNPLAMGQQSAPPTQYYYAQAPHYPGQTQSMQTPMMPNQYVTSGPPSIDPRLVQPHMNDQSGRSPLEHGSISPESRQNVVRGPPRKPKQSGHAIWIGNLPPQTDLMSLVHHVCKETAGLESLFLISKSNCAFANFKDEPTCITAQQKLHDSKFQQVRLVSRLRKSTVEGASGVTAPTGPSAATPAIPATPQQGIPQNTESQEEDVVAAEQKPESPAARIDNTKAVAVTEGPPQRDRFFILKSLTVEDLELSVRTNIWATQSHNEESLNGAFKAVDNVYLIFSANKSGEYFGYARMISPINDDPAAAIEFAPKVQAAADLDLPKAIPTEATAFAPRGRIIDDSARGTIFWEAERDETASSEGAGADDDAKSVSGGGSMGEDASSVRSGQDSTAGAEPNKAWGKPFRLEWLSTTRLPFYRTRGLRNPWNSNREVKIARDGTELEPSVGRKLIGLFNRIQSPAPAVVPGVPACIRPMPVMTGYPPVGLRFPQ